MAEYSNVLTCAELSATGNHHTCLMISGYLSPDGNCRIIAMDCEAVYSEVEQFLLMKKHYKPLLERTHTKLYFVPIANAITDAYTMREMAVKIPNVECKPAIAITRASMRAWRTGLTNFMGQHLISFEGMSPEEEAQRIIAMDAWWVTKEIGDSQSRIVAILVDFLTR